MIENMLLDRVNIYEKQIVNNWWIRTENLILKWTWKGRLSWFWVSWDQERLWVWQIIEDKRKLYLEKQANIKKWDIAEIDWEQFEVLNIYKVKDQIGIKFLTCLVKQIK